MPFLCHGEHRKLPVTTVGGGICWSSASVGVARACFAQGEANFMIGTREIQDSIPKFNDLIPKMTPCLNPEMHFLNQHFLPSIYVKF